MTGSNALLTTLLAATVVCSVVTVGALGTPGAAASASGTSLPHGASNGNYTVDLPFDTDHYPASKNPGGPHNASINHLAATTQELFDGADSPDGLEKLEWVVIGNPDVDFSQCSTSNTAAFGVDRDNDDPGTFTDINLLDYLEKSDFRENSIVLNFYDGDEFAAPTQDDEGGKEAGREDGDKNPELYPEDEIVAHQGYRSSAGPCYRMPDEPGWYQIDGKANGTNWQGQFAEVELTSHYFYVCECDSEREAYETLGPPPGQDDPYDDDSSSSSTPTPTPAPTATATATPVSTEAASSGDGGSGTPTATATQEPRGATTATATPQPQDTASATAQARNTATAADGDGQQTAAATATATAATGGSAGQPPQNQQRSEGVRTPTAGAGPGFGVLAALGGLLALGLLARRR
jgi:hypothetical protein